MATAEQLADEADRARKVRHLVDLATSLIMQARMTRREAEQLVALVRERILMLFPRSEQTYDLLYTGRFKRLIDEFASAGQCSRGVVIPFPAARPELRSDPSCPSACPFEVTFRSETQF